MMSRRPLPLVIAALLVIGGCSGPDGTRIDLPEEVAPPEWVVENTAPPRGRAEPPAIPGPLGSDAVGVLLSTYLPDHILHTNFGGEPFCAYDLYGWAATDTTATAWIWAYCLEYYLSGRELTTGSGTSSPIAIHLSNSPAGWTIDSHEEPELGSLYADSIRRMFPTELADLALYEGSRHNLSSEAEHAARSQLAS